MDVIKTRLQLDKAKQYTGGNLSLTFFVVKSATDLFLDL